jgi:uncharacterized Tic20 family protein
MTQPPPSPGGYPPGNHPSARAGTDDRTWALITHFGGAAGTFVSFGPLGFVAPLVAYVAQGQRSAAVRAHSVAALNFFIPVSAAGVALFIVRWFAGAVFGGTLLWNPVNGLLGLVQAAVWVLGVVFGIIGGLRANDGQVYKYPLSYPIMK